MKTKQPSTWPLWLFSVLWIIGTIAGMLVAALLFNVPFGELALADTDSSTEGLLGGLVGGLAAGLLVGGLQALILRLVFRSTWRWFVATTLAMGLILALEVTVPGDAVWAVPHLVGGIYLGVAQAWAWHRNLRAGMLLIGATFLAWPSGIWLGQIITPVGATWLIEQTYAITGAGLLLGITSGTILLALRSQPDRGVASTTSALPAS